MRILTILLLSLFLGQPMLAQDSKERQQAQGQITGTVYTRASNIPLEGVEVISSGTTESYITDAEGNFTIPTFGSEVWLTFSYPDYSQKKVLIRDKGPHTIILSPLTEASMDSDIPGYFGDKIKYKNSAYEYLSVDQLLSSDYTTPGLLMQGRFAGLNSTATSGMPGEGAILDIRGISSLFGNNKPMIIVDGMPLYSNITASGVTPGNLHNPLKSVDVKDIQSIEVIKDGGSLYGIRGSGGLIMITTRQAESLNTIINFSAYRGMSMQPENIQMMNTAQHKVYMVNQLQNSGTPFAEILQQNPWITGNPSYFYYYNYNNETDWQDEIFKPANTNKFNVELKGGDEIARFAIMLGYLNQYGVVENTGYQRYSFRLNSNIKVLQDLSLISNIGFSYHISDMNNFGADPTLNPISAAMIKSPMFGPYLRDKNGDRIAIFSDADEYGFSNPAAIINNSLSKSYESNFSTNLKLLYEPGQDLKLTNITHVSFNNVRDNAFIPDYGITDFSFGELYNTAAEGILINYALANETSFDLQKEISDVHFIHTQGGFRVSSNRLSYNTGQVYNTPTDEFRSLSSVSLVENTYINGLAQTANYSDIFLNNGYRFKDKYLVDLILTLSASSNTGNEVKALNMLGGKWGFFPSIHAGWLLSSEPFLKSIDAIDLLKLRASYSIAGNDFYTEQNKYYYMSRTYGLNSGVVRAFLPNESLKWETVNQLNAGVDAVLFKEILSVGIDVYQRVTNDLLVYKELPAMSGYEHYWENNGSMNSNGIELKAELFPINGDFKVKIGGNLNLSRSVVAVDNDILLDIPGGTVIIRNGEAPFSYFGLQSDGIYRTVTEAADAGLVNANGIAYEAGDVKFSNNVTDEVINNDDRAILGNLHANINAGLHVSLSYRNFSIYALGEYTGGNQLFNYSRMQIESFSGLENQSIAAQYAWKNENDDTTIPKVSLGDPVGNASFSDRWIETGAFMRLRELTVAYTLPKTAIYENLKIYISGQNLVTHSEYLGYYPEFSYSDNPALQGTDYGRIPLTPQVIAGIKVGF